jgi:type II secretory pathway predicted ATPase ExeA
MIEEYWGLQFNPFQNVLSDRWYYESPMHEETLSRLYYVIEQRQKCGLLCGEEGTGKSLLFEIIARQAKRSQRQVALIDTFGMEEGELLWKTLGELGLGNHSSKTRGEQWRLLSDHLHGATSAHQQVVLLFDHLSQSDPQCRLLAERLLHLPACTKGWVTVIVSTSPLQLKEIPAGILSQVDLKITLDPLDAYHTGEYVNQAIQKAGSKKSLFPVSTMHHMHEQTLGIPRRINRLCHLSLLSAIETNAKSVDPDLFLSSSKELVVG